MMRSLTDINARLRSTEIGVAHIHVDVDNNYRYLETLAIHTISPLLHTPSKLREMLKTLKEVWPKTHK